MTNLEAVYRQLARPWPADELAERYQAAYERGAGDLPVGEDPPERPITLLATAIPRLISLAVAANVLHLLPTGTHDAADLAGELIATIDATATGSLHRCHLALQSDGESRGYDADEWLPLAYEQAADWLEHASPAADPPSADRARPAGRPVRRAGDRLPGPRRTQRARGDHRLPRTPPVHLRVRRRRRPLSTRRLATPGALPLSRARATWPGTRAGVRFPRRL